MLQYRAHSPWQRPRISPLHQIWSVDNCGIFDCRAKEEFEDFAPSIEGLSVVRGTRVGSPSK
jgi:hypothetical protein